MSPGHLNFKKPIPFANCTIPRQNSTNTLVTKIYISKQEAPFWNIPYPPKFSKAYLLNLFTKSQNLTPYYRKKNNLSNLFTEKDPSITWLPNN